MTILTPRFDWLHEPRLVRIVAALCSAGEARFVGGCVRDSLLGDSPLDNPAIDIDIATTLTPDEMKPAFAAAGIRAVATGEAHGTVTAVADGLVAECTALRADEVTDGRHATVRFTKDWDEDWRRRDFTINALYADSAGKLWDPAGGLDDLKAGRVRFIGEPEERITEDALRILRFFRFSARFADRFDPEGLAAVTRKAALLDILSRERVWSEVSRTLHARRAPAAFEAAEKAGILAHVLPGTARTDVFRRVHGQGPLSDALGLAALWPGVSEDTLRKRLKPSVSLIAAYLGILAARDAIASRVGPHEVLYRFGRAASLDGARLASAEGTPVPGPVAAALNKDPVPVLPLSGKDIVARGVPPGPEVGAILDAFERCWLDAGAPADLQWAEETLSMLSGGKSSS